MWFCGLDSEQSAGLPCIPLSGSEDRSNWSTVLKSGIAGMKEKGFDAVYLIAEEHVPLQACHVEHLNETLPTLMQSLQAVYISLMGWDNRRYVSRSPCLGKVQHQLKHLVGKNDPRFHLHPALWSLEILEVCCDVALADKGKNGSAWHFEKSCESVDSALPAMAKSSCYQIRASTLSLTRKFTWQSAVEWGERFFYHKLMAFYPLISRTRIGAKVARKIPFDDVFCDGPYPMFFSGIMAKGKLNKHCVRFLARHNKPLLNRILETIPNGRV